MTEGADAPVIDYTGSVIDYSQRKEDEFLKTDDCNR